MGLDNIKLVKKAMKNTEGYYFFDRLYNEKKEATYNKKQILAGWNRNNRKYYYKFSDDKSGEFSSRRLLWCGATGSGKSVCLQGCGDRASLSSFGRFIIDPHGEYYTSKNPVQEELTELLDEGEEPKGFDNLKIYFPFFLRKYAEKINEDAQFIQLSLSMLTKYDLMTILGEEDETQPKGRAITMAFNEIEKGSIGNFVELKDFITKLGEEKTVDPRTANSLLGMINSAIAEGVLGEEHIDFDFGTDIANGFIPILDLSGSGSAGLSEKTGYTSSFVSVIGEQVWKAKISGEIPRDMPIMMQADELHRFMPASSNSSSKRFIIKVLKEGRKFGLSFSGATQNPQDLDARGVEQMSYIMISWNMKINTAHGILDNAGLMRESPSVRNRFKDIKNSMGEYEWIVIDMDSAKPDFTSSNRQIDDNIIVKVAGPISEHFTEGM